MNYKQLCEPASSEAAKNFVYLLYSKVGFMRYIVLTFLALLLAFQVLGQWTPVNTGCPNVLASVFFTNSRIGYAAGVNGTILKTTNSGGKWTQLNSGVITLLNSVYFTSADTGVVAGENGTILKTENGGLSWNLITVLLAHDLSAVFFTDSQTGYAVGGQNDEPWGMACDFLKTVDGGESWVSISNAYSYPLYSVYFTSRDTGYAGGYEGEILKTTDGGSSYTVTPVTDAPQIMSLYFINKDTGYAAAQYWPPSDTMANGKIIKTIDGGNTWNAVYDNGFSTLWSLFFTSPRTGFAAGDDGKIVKTNDYGKTWYSINSSSGGLNSLYFPCRDTGFAVGGTIGDDSSFVLKTVNGGGYPSGISSERKPSGTLKIYPNPASDALTAEIREAGRITILDMTGRQLMESEANPTLKRFDVTLLSPGAYILLFKNDRTVLEGKFMKN